MWIGHNKGWLSIVEHGDKPQPLLVRAREQGAILTLWPESDLYEDMNADYPFRADILREEVADGLCNVTLNIDYDNFKGSVVDRKLGYAYDRVWNIMWTYGLEYREMIE